MAGGEPEPLMSPAEMKPLLLLSKRAPVNCAIGLARDKSGVVLLDKRAKPRKMLALMKTKAKAAGIELDMPSCRFGKAVVDTETDAALVQFIVNKDAPGAMRPKLLALIKKSGFQKCVISVDTTLENEPEDEAPEGEEAAQASAGATLETQDASAAAAAGDAPTAEAATAASAVPDDASQETAAPAAAESGGAAQAASAAGADGDAAGVQQRLVGLVKQMMGALGSNPPGLDAMKAAAVAGQAALKGGDMAGATAAADQLEQLLGGAAGAAAPQAAAGAAGPKNGMGSPVFNKAKLTWVATRKKVEDELEKLHSTIQAAYKDHGVVDDLEKAFRTTVEPVLGNLDHTLLDKLDEVGEAADAASHSKLVSEAQAIINKYQGYLGSEPLIAKLDENPFVPLALEKTLTASLGVLAKAVA